MPSCPTCGTDNAAGRKFCGSCGSSLAVACPACGAANEPGMRFCGECGSALEAEAPAAAPARVAERRLVSVLFADLVGFTPLSESRDPEEVRDLLSRYFDTCRRLIGIYGGTVEKFIGDAVMAVWGTPAAKEDDAERAVRAALDLVAAVAQLGAEVGAPDLRLRAGVLTGEAAVTIGAESEGMVAGDLVNTAARIQAAAEPGTVLVGEATKRASDASIAYESAGTFELKGKADVVALYRAMRVTSIRGGALRSGELEPPFVGRDRELHLVKDLFHATAEERRAQLVSINGIGGIGKSRLAWEYEKYLDGVAELVWWHRGRCLAYGDGVAYWALAEMVRMRALISDEDAPAAARAKLGAVLADVVPDADERAWIEPRLQQLLCLADGTDERQTLFAAWRTFFERLADNGPVVLVFEDLQWADAGLLDFVEHLLEWSRAHPIFVLVLARPELYERRPGFGARNATALALEPLPEAAMAELLDGFVPGLPRDLHARILERAEGVPLYAVETVRMLLDRGLLERDGDVYRPTGEIEMLDVPETLHALVAARLDGLSPDERRVLQDAAVLGKSFTRAGLASITGLDEDSLDPLLASLVRKEVLSVQADPRSPERGQYGFLQDLLKRIAYETLSRADRKARHLAAAAYLDRVASSERDIVEVIAAHYLDAYEAAPDADDASALRAKAAERLTQAGDRAASVAANEEAQRYYEKAAELVDDDALRATIVERAGEAAVSGSRWPDALDLLERAAAAYTEQGAAHAAARVAARIGWALWRSGDIVAGADRLEAAVAALADEEPDAETASVIEGLARLRYFQGRLDEAAERIERSLEIAEALVAPHVLVDALNTKSLILRARHREQEARALLERAIAIGREHEALTPLARAVNNLCVRLNEYGDIAAAHDLAREGLEIARRAGMREGLEQFFGTISWTSWMLGRWDDSLAARDELMATGGYGSFYRTGATIFTAVPRGDLAQARAALAEHAVWAGSDDAQLRSGYRYLEAVVLQGEGRSVEAAAVARDAAEIFAGVSGSRHPWLFDVELTALADAGDAERLADALEAVDSLSPLERPPIIRAVAAYGHGRLGALRNDVDDAVSWFIQASDLFASMQLPYPRAVTLVHHAETLAEAGRFEEASPLLDEARKVFEGLAAVVWLQRISRVAQIVPA